MIPELGVKPFSPLKRNLFFFVREEDSCTQAIAACFHSSTSLLLLTAVTLFVYLLLPANSYLASQGRH